MRAILDINGRYTTQAGVARYIRGLIGGLRGAAPSGFEIREFAWEVENLKYQQPQRALKTIYRELIWAPFIAPVRLRRLRPDVIHNTALPIVRPTRGVPHVATLHDLAILRHPERFRRWQLASSKFFLDRIARADRMLCISQFTADEAIALLGVSPRRIEVVHNGCDFVDHAPEDRVPEFPVPSEFFLFVGSLEPGKNLHLLRLAYESAANEGRPLPPLLLVGARWEGVPGEGPPPVDWHYLGRQPDEVLVYLYRHALALLFPSKYEGFGLPIAEAMSLGCPVVCSPVASLPEVAGDAAEIVPLDPIAYRDAIRRLTSDSSLRKSLQDRGRIQAARFTWDRCARGTLAVYQAAMTAVPARDP
jgi:alpha-1,3-rhamnosyl/mannosyltransferase